MTMHITPINLKDHAKKIMMPWSPVDLLQVNDHHVILAKFKGEYPVGFHTHDYDELFFVCSGEIIIRMKDRSPLILKAGEMGVVPKGIEHCSGSIHESTVIIFEPQAIIPPTPPVSR